MELFVQLVAAPLVGIIPFSISLLMCWLCSSCRRWLAVALALFSGAIFLFEVYSASVRGNLTGLIWMLSLPVVLIAVVVLYVLEKVSMRLEKSESLAALESRDKALPNHGADAKG